MRWLIWLLLALPLQAQAPSWQAWGEAPFDQAARENKLVILDVEAVWCHWCHVMDETTYHDPAVQKLLAERYVCVKVDQDARPDIANRYKDYGWPATIIFKADGTELVKLEGYVKPERMAAILQKLADNPVSEVQATVMGTSTGTLTPELRQELDRLIADRYDNERGGWGRVHKFLNWETGEYYLVRAARGDAEPARMIRTTLDKQKLLVDPVWGGVYQYSHGGVWENPHYEKIMLVQAENMRLYAMAYALWGSEDDLRVAQSVRSYLNGFLRGSNGAYYSSQDADLVQGEHSHDYFALDDAGRRKLGLPRVDKHQYARENGWVIQGLVGLYSVTGDQAVLDDALRAADWVVKERSLPGGGYSHDARDSGGPYLGDTLAAGRAFLALYTVTADPVWLQRASACADFLEAKFRLAAGGYATAVSASKIDQPYRMREENIGVARFGNLLFQHTGEARYQTMSSYAMSYLAHPEVAREFSPGGVLLADLELAQAVPHLTVVGQKTDPAARALFLAALRYPLAYRRVDWAVPGEKALPYTETEYPTLGRAAIFVCSGTKCSPPTLNPADVSRSFPRAARP